MDTLDKDKILISVLLPNEVMSSYKSDDNGLMRSYKNANGDITLIIFDKLYTKGLSAILSDLLLNPNFNVAVTRFDGMILVFLTKERPVRIVVGEAQEPIDYDDANNDEDYNEEDQPYAYTNGKWSPCPYCGSEYITTFMDGTAQCEDCKREFRYLQK